MADFCLTLTRYATGTWERGERLPPHLDALLGTCGAKEEANHRRSGKPTASVGVTTSLARGASDECDTAVALPLTAVSSQNVIGSFEARFFCARARTARDACARRAVRIARCRLERRVRKIMHISDNSLSPRFAAKPALFARPTRPLACGPRRRSSARCAAHALSRFRS